MTCETEKNALMSGETFPRELSEASCSRIITTRCGGSQTGGLGAVMGGLGTRQYRVRMAICSPGYTSLMYVEILG